MSWSSSFGPTQLWISVNISPLGKFFVKNLIFLFRGLTFDPIPFQGRGYLCLFQHLKQLSLKLRAADRKMLLVSFGCEDVFDLADNSL